MTAESDGRGLALLTIHGLTWLAAGNAVGLLLSTLLLLPGLQDVLAPLSFGRWAPVHLDMQLYGWCGVILIVLLCRVFMPARGAAWLPELAVGVWSGSVLFGVVSWLTGHSSGKPFLEFAGAARVALAGALAVLEVLLAIAFVMQLREPVARTRYRRAVIAAKIALLAGLAAVPAIVYWAAGLDVRPPINPASGGPTGVSLLGSTLVVVAIVIALPLIVGSTPRGGARDLGVPLTLLAAHTGWFALLDHANHSHREWLQQVSVASLAIWIPVLVRYYRRFDWPAGSTPWLGAFAAWGAALVLSGALVFLPGGLERFKFTNVLVSHAHLAMAGMLTSFNVLVLAGVDRGRSISRLFADRAAFGLWQGGCVLFVLAMLTLGLLEGFSPDNLLAGRAAAVLALQLLRWIAGAAMLWASWRWLDGALRQWSVA